MAIGVVVSAISTRIEDRDVEDIIEVGEDTIVGRRHGGREKNSSPVGKVVKPISLDQFEGDAQPLHAATIGTSGSRLLVEANHGRHCVGHYSRRGSLENQRKGGGDCHHTHFTKDRKESRKGNYGHRGSSECHLHLNRG
ncbi:hypothetical protein CRG98_045503 [Punica granatum]|uniref:Uncharacterized protein n=1 Tax=Punica granatum TaxID=22663 RepID=A0A2I0HR01_PUNGR|nr:hypothetical protein CRG98_045503 [Punica granatum]